MKETELALLMKGMAPVIGKLISTSMAPLVERIADLEQKLAAAPVPKDGRDGTSGTNGVDGKDGAPGQNGKDADPISPEQIATAVAEYLAANPPAAGQDGADGSDGTNGKDGQSGRDGVGLADALLDQKGALVLTMTDGRTKELGIVIGKDGAPGLPGSDGVDGLSFDDIDLIDSPEGLSLRFARGETVKDFCLPAVVDCGVFREAGSYRKGNGVTWGGSFWIAQKDAPGKPDTPDSGWRLAVKKGQNGKDLTK